MPRVPVFYLDTFGAPTLDPVNGQPCIKLCIGWDAEAGNAKRLHPRSFREIVGLIDTGAQGIMVDDSLVQELGLPWTREMETRTSIGTLPMRGYVCQLHFPFLDWTRRSEVFSSPLRASGNPYEALLGRDFLSCVEFSWTTNGISHLEVVSPTAPLINFKS